MRLKTIQWNIGGGLIRTKDSDPTRSSSYSIDGIDSIVELLKNERPDIITFQEIHSGAQDQIKEIADRLGMKHFAVDAYDHSHLTAGSMLSLGIVSKYPIYNHIFELFLNPNLEVNFGGKIGLSHDKGVSTVTIKLGGKALTVKTLHLVPFRRAGVDPLDEKLVKVREDITKKLSISNGPQLIQGDFNYNNDSLRDFLPGIFKDKTQEILQNEATTPKGRKYDHIVYSGLQLLDNKVIGTVLTDHYPLVMEFALL